MTDSVYEQTLEEVARIIRNLGLDGLSYDDVEVRKLPNTDGYLYRGVTVSWTPEVEYRPEMSTNERDTVGYPCLVTMVTGTGKGTGENIDRLTKWRQKIRRRFNCNRLDRVYDSGTHHIICRVTHTKNIHLPDEYENNNDVSQMLVICWFLEPRDG